MDFIRVQSLKWQERFSTTYLHSLQQSIIDAQQQLYKKEYEILGELIEIITQHSQEIEELCDQIAEIDISATMSLRLNEQRVIPTIVSDWTFSIKEGRHPVVEYFLPTSDQFIPNDCFVNKDRNFHLITWPNMWGKSTYLRQNALILILDYGTCVTSCSCKSSFVFNTWWYVCACMKWWCVSKKSKQFVYCSWWTRALNIYVWLNVSSEIIMCPYLSKNTSSYVICHSLSWINFTRRANTMIYKHECECVWNQ